MEGFLIYTYSLSQDTANGQFGDSLEQSIKESSITIALNGVSVDGDTLNISFKSSLTVSEKESLDSIVSGHDGSNISDDQPLRFQEVLPNGGERVSDRGFQFTASAGLTTSFDYPVTEDLFVKEGFAIAYDFAKEDSVSMAIVHPIAGVLHYYLKDLPLDIHRSNNLVGIVKAENKAITETNFNGLTIRVSYQSTGPTDVHVCVTMRTYS